MKILKRIIALLAIGLFILAFLTSCAAETENAPAEEPAVMAVMVNDTVYYYTGQKVELLRCGVMDGQITKTVAATALPDENDRSNFGKDYEYQYVGENHIDIVMEAGWIRFCSGYCEKAVAEGAEHYNTSVQDHSQTLTEELYTEWVGEFVPDYDTENYDSTHYSGIPETVNPGGPDIPAHSPECPYSNYATDDGEATITTDGCICGYPLEEAIKTFPGHIAVVENIE